jgi:hypothetical protein
MKTFIKTAAQGEISITKIDRLPAGVKPIDEKSNHFIVGHSETGHHHVMTMDRAQFFEAPDQPSGMRILFALLEAPNALEHLRDFDTHETISFDAGIYEFRTGREFDPYAEIARKQAD